MFYYHAYEFETYYRALMEGRFLFGKPTQDLQKAFYVLSTGGKYRDISPKYNLYSAHDTNVAAILMYLTSSDIKTDG